MELLVLLEEDSLHIQKNKMNFYSIPKKSLADITMIREQSISKWIAQLNQKSWATSELLYQIASFTQRLFPSNKIDWNSTFYIIEKKDYTDKAWELKNSLEKGFNTDSKADFMDYIEFSNNFRDSEMEDEVKKIVKQQLRNYNIVL